MDKHQHCLDHGQDQSHNLKELLIQVSEVKNSFCQLALRLQPSSAGGARLHVRGDRVRDASER